MRSQDSAFVFRLVSCRAFFAVACFSPGPGPYPAAHSGGPQPVGGDPCRTLLSQPSHSRGDGQLLPLLLAAHFGIVSAFIFCFTLCCKEIALRAFRKYCTYPTVSSVFFFNASVSSDSLSQLSSVLTQMQTS